MKPQNTLFYSRKGGQGKTTLSAMYAQYAGAHLTTFDFDNGSRQLFEALLPKNHYHELSPNDKLAANPEYSNVFDFGGYLDQRVKNTAKVCQQCVVPIAAESRSETKPFIDTIEELSKHNNNIIIVINKTEKAYTEALIEQIKKRYTFPIFVIPRTKFISKFADYGLNPVTLFESGEASILQRHHLKTLSPKLKDFFDYISKEK